MKSCLSSSAWSFRRVIPLCRGERRNNNMSLVGEGWGVPYCCTILKSHYFCIGTKSCYVTLLYRKRAIRLCFNVSEWCVTWHMIVSHIGIGFHWGLISIYFVCISKWQIQCWCLIYSSTPVSFRCQTAYLQGLPVLTCICSCLHVIVVIVIGINWYFLPVEHFRPSVICAICKQHDY